MADQDGALSMASRMSLRDYFAAKAMQGWISNSPSIGETKLNGSAEHAERISEVAYRWADAMLKAREDRNA